MSKGFYIASYPTSPYRYEIGYHDLRTLMNNDVDQCIVVHLFIEHVDAESWVEKIIKWFIDRSLHDIESIPGKTLIKVPLDQLKSHVISYATPKWWWW